MMYLSSPSFVAAISNAGALGVLCSAMYRSYDAFRDAVKETNDLTDKPWSCNLNLFPSMHAMDNAKFLEMLVEGGVKTIETSGHKAPEDLAKRFKDAGVTWIHKCVGLRYAKKAESLGADIVTVVGYENGGATGTLDIGTMVLIPTVVQGLDVPVIGGGGIGTGRGLAAALALGAQGVIMGTRFMMSEECPIHKDLKLALAKANETETILVMRTLHNTHRLWKNNRAELILELEDKNAPMQEIIQAAAGSRDREMFETGALDVGTVSLGQGVGLLHDIKPCKDIVHDIMAEANQTIRGLAQ